MHLAARLAATALSAILGGPSLLLTAEPAFERSSAIAYAMERNPGLQAARLSVAQAQAARDLSGLRPNPAIEAELGSGAAIGNSRSFDYLLGISQAIPMAGRLEKQKAVAAFAILRAEIEILQLEQSIAAEICELVLELQIVRRRAELQSEFLAAAQATSQLAAAAAARGELPIGAAHEAALEERLQAQELEQIEFDEEKLLHRLAPLLGRPSHDHLVFTTKPLPAPSADLRGYDDSVLERHPEHLMNKLAGQSAAAHIELTRAERWEPLTARVFMKSERRPGQPSGADTERLLGAGVSVPLPLRRKSDLGVAAGQIDLTRARLETDATRFRIENEIEHARHEANRLRVRAETFESRVLDLAHAQLEQQRRAFEAGQIDQIELLRAEARAQRLKWDLLDLLDEYARAELELELARRDLPGFP